MQIPDVENGTIVAWAAGAVGSALSMQWISGFTWKQRLAMVATGMACAVLLTVPIMQFVGMPDGWIPGMSFLVGLFGWSALGGIMHTLQKADWWGLIQDIVRRLINRGS